MRRPIHDHDGQERYKVSLVLFSHSVSEKWSFSRPLLTVSPRLLFKFVLKIFYGSIVVENSDLIPPDGGPWSASPLTFSLFFAQRNLQHRLRKSQQLSHRCSVRSHVLHVTHQLLTRVSSKGSSRHRAIKGTSPSGSSCRQPLGLTLTNRNAASFASLQRPPSLADRVRRDCTHQAAD
jgi:hypothetical protein